MAPNLTLLDLVNAVAEHARSEAEMIATIVYIVNKGHVRLCGTFKGARFDRGDERDAHEGIACWSPLRASRLAFREHVR
jgi:hypothetical protein